MATLLEYKCPCCGGALSFDSSLQKLKCPYCDTEFETKTLQEMDEVLKQTQAEDDIHWNTEEKAQWGEEEQLNSYSCQSCGGEIITDATTAATSCPYCGNAVVLAGKLSGQLKPDLVIPFKLDKDAAIKAFHKHLTGKRLLPKVFKTQNHIEEIKGIYVPFWLYDAQADANLRFHATRVRTWSDSSYNHTETKHYSVVRSGKLRFLDVPVDGSSKMPDDLMESIEPFDLKQAVDFQTAYLAGYLADKYDADAKQCEPRANQRIKTSTEQAFAATVTGYTTVRPEQSSVHVGQGNVQYALLPVWTLTTQYKGKSYLFAMNGQTGKFVGNLPLDKGAYFRWLAGISGVVAAASYVLAWIAGWM